MKIGITERGDAGLNQSWRAKLQWGQVDGAILITKCPSKLLELVLPRNTIIHCTITGHGGTFLEPNVKSWKEELEAATELLNKYGPERVVLRIDPILWPPFDSGINLELSPSLTIAHEGRAKGFQRLRISFADAYPHVIARIQKFMSNFNPSFHMDISWRTRMWEKLGKPEICGEPGMSCSGCISRRDVEAMGLLGRLSGNKGRQRFSCLCLAEKTELLTNKKPCPNGCLYCYWKDEK
jgi:hypothetical protein